MVLTYRNPLMRMKSFEHMNDLYNQPELLILKRFEQYVEGELSKEKVDEFWIEFIQDPDWFDYFLTYLHFMLLLNNSKAPNSN